MKKIDLGQTVGILANVGVIAGIVFLGVEIRENREQESVSNSLFAGTEIATWMRSVSENEDQADLFLKGAQSYSSLSDLEQVRYDLLMRSAVLHVGGAQLAIESGLAVAGSQGESRIVEGTFLRFLDQPGFREWWETTDRRGIPTPLADTLDQLLASER